MEKLLSLDYDWIHSKIIYNNSPPRLYQIALVNVSLSVFNSKLEVKRTNQIISNIQKQITETTIPKSVGNDIASTLRWMKIQLLEFKKLICLNKKRTHPFTLDRLHWTSQGTIDKMKTVETMSDAKDLSKPLKMQIAVVFCLEDQVESLSFELPNTFTLRSEDCLSNISQMNNIPIAKSHFKLPKTKPDFKHCFRKMLKMENELASHYYWQLLTDKEKLDILEPKFINNLYCSLDSSYMVFIFTHCDREKRFQLLQHQNHRYNLLRQLLNPQWLQIFNGCIKDVVKSLVAQSVVNLIDICAKRMLIGVYKEKYVDICVLLLKHTCIEYSAPTLQKTDVRIAIMEILRGFMLVGEMQLIKLFLETVDIEWIKLQFSTCFSLNDLVKATLACDMLEYVVSCAFQTTEDRNNFLSTKESYINNLIDRLVISSLVDGMNKFLNLVFTNKEDLKNYKAKFAEEKGYELCSRALTFGKWIAANKFVKCCFDTKEEIACFYKKFLKSRHFAALLNPVMVILTQAMDFPRRKESDYLKKTIDTVVSFLKTIGRETSNDLVLDACLLILSKHYINFYFMDENRSKLIFRAQDKLLPAIHGKQKKLTDWKKEFFINKNTKLYVSLPLDFLKKQIKEKRPSFCEEWKIKDEMSLWQQMTDDFFTWICSSDEKLKAELANEFWNLEEVLEAKKSLKGNKKLKTSHKIQGKN